MAEAKARKKKAATSSRVVPSSGISSAASVKRRVMANCAARIHRRLVPKRSSTGVHNGLIAQGSISRLVQKAIALFVIPSDLKRTALTAATTAYGPPSAK